MIILWADISRPTLRRLSAVWKITEAIGSLTSEPVPDFYRGQTDKAVIVKDLLRRRLHEKGLNLSEIGRREALWTGSVTDHSTVHHSINKDMRGLAGAYRQFYRKAKSTIDAL